MAAAGTRYLLVETPIKINKKYNTEVTEFIRCILAPINISHPNTSSQSIETISKAHLSILHLPMHLKAAPAIWEIH
jgi:hypothetical protein